MIIETLKCNCDCGGDVLEYTYKLIQRELRVDTCGQNQSIKAYGVEVESKRKNNDKIVQASKEEVKYLTPYKYKGSQFLHMLEKNMVSPIHLFDVTEDVIEEFYKDFDKEIFKQYDKVTV